MSESPSADASPSSWMAWAQLVRLPNVFTIIADVGAAYLMMAGGPKHLPSFAFVICCGIALYWAGMILNDVFDVERDRQERPGRPIPAGQIALSQAVTAGWMLLLIGVLLSVAVGFLSPGVEGFFWQPVAVAIALAVMIVAYDGPLKRSPLAPVAMGGCRVLSCLLGAFTGLGSGGGLGTTGGVLPNFAFAIAAGFGVYIMGLTTMARREATGGRSPNLWIGWLVLLVGVSMMAFAPQLERYPSVFQVRPNMFAVLIYLVAAPAVFRALRAIIEPEPLRIQLAIRVSIMTIIPLAACFAFLGAGPAWGMAIFLLTIPSTMLSIRFRVT
ncbi:MAG: UbiA family prenyltransferase [Planctomycetota bacterium]